MVQDFSVIASNGFLHGYNGIVLVVILLQAAGGIVSEYYGYLLPYVILGRICCGDVR